ncbi:hypothetical protein H7H82_14615 [Mycobacterium heidelbergense]|uniref:Uncharacterized protein n=1 Tax=Mycobacterium heidelbergense TaxID=53376 RepID=A0A1X0DT72_MYCHE|nr:hypothetical protein [Mycobacterium heidelbergense]MCV7051808.1 hypothetical protein [Mycobacterium heidelbergense]ORA75392.1 hypothetical protein BST25_05535 [Mycobacterium heidelbergense]BBZ50198.1 hypothetical protein MHEI_19150 [Mycobacterium heidelbergense]
MDIRNSPDVEVIRDAERILYREKWRVCEECAAQRLAQTSSLKWTCLFPGSPVIMVVAVDGVVVGRIRRDADRWIATGTGQRGPVADCGTFRAAALALASEAQPCDIPRQDRHQRARRR